METTRTNKDFTVFTANTHQKYKKAMKEDAKKVDDGMEQEFSTMDQEIIANIFARKIKSGELDKLPNKSKGIGELNIEYNEDDLSDDKEIRALQFKQIIDNAIANSSKICVKDKKLQQIGQISNQIAEIDAKIQKKFFEISELFYAYDEKNDEIENYLTDFRKNIDIQKIEFGDSVSVYQKAVEPFQTKAKKELDGYRKYIASCKELKSDVEKLQSKLLKTSNNLHTTVNEAINSKDYSDDMVSKINNLLVNSTELVISIKATTDSVKDVIEDIESTYKFYKKDFNETNERYNGYVSSMSCSQM